ncbi:unnamed protein product [Phaeothamnion confervicola]
MSASLTVGSALIAFGPPAALIVLIVAQRASLLILLVTSAFFWLVSALLASLLWTAFPVAREQWLLVIIGGVSLQEFTRIGFVRLYKRAEKVILDATPTHQQMSSAMLVELNDVTSSIAAGVGWGTMHGAIFFGTVLAENRGPGAAYSEACPRVPLVLFSSWVALLFIALDVALSGLMFSSVGGGAGSSSDPSGVAGVFVLHFAASLPTLLHEIPGGCAASLPLMIGVVAAAYVALWRRWRKHPVRRWQTRPQRPMR